MPTYKITAPDGTIIRVTGDSPPTEQEAESLYSAAKPALRSTAAAAPSEGEAGLEGFGRALKAPIQLAGAIGGAVTGLNPRPAAEMVQGQVQQSIGSLKESVDPNLSTVERLGNLIGAIPGIGPATQSFGRGLGAPLASALVEGKVPTAEEKAQQAGAVGEGFGNLALMGAGQGASNIGKALVRARQGAEGARGMAGLGKEPTPIEMANEAIGVTPKHVRVNKQGEIKVNPGARVLSEGIDLSKPTDEIVSQISNRLDEVKSLKESILETRFGNEKIPGDVIPQIRDLLDDVIRDAKRVGNKKLAEQAQATRRYVFHPKIKGELDLTYPEADTLAHDLWRMKTTHLTGKRLRPLAAAVEQVYGVIQEGMPAGVKAYNASMRDLISAQDAAMKKLAKETAAGPAAASKAEGTGSLVRQIVRQTPVIPGTPGATQLRIIKLLERAIPGGS